jgi:hypothetical protein
VADATPTSPDLTYTLPPPNLVMPHTVQEVIIVTFVGGAALLAVYAAYLAVTRRSWLPMLFLLAGMFSIMLEPLADVLGNVIHPPIGQDFAFQAKGHPIPWHITLAYIWYYGMLNIFLFDRFRTRTMTPATWWKVAAITGVAVTIVEQAPIYFGAWVYYGEHGIKLGLMPLSMAAANCASVMIPSLLIYRLWPILKGWRQLLVLALVPCVVVGTHTGASVPSYLALGQDTASTPHWILQGASLLTAGFSVMLIWLGIALVHNRIPAEEPVATSRGAQDTPTPSTEGQLLHG